MASGTAKKTIREKREKKKKNSTAAAVQHAIIYKKCSKNK